MRVVKTNHPILRPCCNRARGALLCVLFGALPAGAQPLQWDDTFTPAIVHDATEYPGLELVSFRDGQYLVHGTFRRIGGEPARGLVRLAADGSRLATFDYTGEPMQRGDLVAALDDGRFVIVHDADVVDGNRVARIRRYRADGSLDTSFNEIASSPGVCNGLLRTPDGRTLVFGQFTALGGLAVQGLARLSVDGTLDVSYAPVLIGATTRVHAALSVSPNDVLVSASNGSIVFLARLGVDGTRDETFHPAQVPALPGAGGKLEPLPPLAVLADGSVLFGGPSATRLNADGSSASGFELGPGGILASYFLRAAETLPNGDLLTEVTTYGDFSIRTNCQRRSPGGTVLGLWPDNFLNGVTPAGNIVGRADPISERNDEPGGLFSILWRDPGFTVRAPTGDLIATAAPAVNYPAVASRVRALDDGRILVSGPFSKVGDVLRPGLARLLPDGTLDATFVPPTTLGTLIIAGLEPDGAVWVYYPDPTNFFGFRLERLAIDGAIDASLPADCELRTAAVRILGHDPQDRVLAAVLVPDSSGGIPFTDLAFFDPSTGEREWTWPTVLRSALYVDEFFTQQQPRDAIVLDDGSLLVDGWFREVNGTNVTYEVNGVPIVGGPLKLRPDGTVDTGYRANLAALRVTNTHRLLPGGRALVNVAANTTGITPTRTICIDANGVAGLGFQLLPGELQPPPLDLQKDGSLVALGAVLQRWRADGSRDFNAVPALDGVTRDSEMTPDRSLLIAGTFGLKRLVPVPATGITLAPSSQTVAIGQIVRFIVEVGDDGTPAYQWQFNGVDLPGATQSTLELGAVTEADAGIYRANVRVGSLLYTSAPAELRVRSTSARLVNFSARSRVRPAAPQIAGFVLRSPTPRPVLLRAIGGGLNLLDSHLSTLPDGRLALYFDKTVVADVRGGLTDPVVISVAERVGAFRAIPLIPGLFPERNYGSAFAPTLGGGVYTIHTTSNDDRAGISLFEFYDAAEATEPGDVLNVSLRGRTAPGDDTMIGGFVVTGAGPITLLVRVVGPELAQWNVPDVLANPQLTLFANAQIIGTNDDWSTPLAPGAMSVHAATTSTGAFPLDPASESAALVATLEPGAYTVHASGANGSAGEVLLEIYVVEE